MSGHSKWATTKHKKAAIDAKRGKLFARLIKNIEVAAKTGGPDPDGNPTLFDAIQKAKKNSVPSDNIDRALKRASGEGKDGVQYEQITYEAYAQGGVAVMIEVLTDNRNRAASDVRVALTRTGGTLAESGSVAYMFNRTGVVEVPNDGTTDEDEILMAVLDAGAEEVADEGENFEVYCAPNDVVEVRKALVDAGIDYNSAEVQFVPSMKVAVDLETAQKVLKLLDALDDVDDIQNVYSNIDIPDDVAAQLEEEE